MNVFHLNRILTSKSVFDSLNEYGSIFCLLQTADSDQNHSLASSYPCSSSSKPHTAHFPMYLQGTTGGRSWYSLVISISSQGSSFLHILCCNCSMANLEKREWAPSISVLCSSVEGITALLGTQDNSTNRFQSA